MKTTAYLRISTIDQDIEKKQVIAEKFMKLIERLEDLDETQEVYHNADISDEVMAQL